MRNGFYILGVCTVVLVLILFFWENLERNGDAGGSIELKLEQLRSLPYLDVVKRESRESKLKRGTTIYERGHVYDGCNLYTNTHHSPAGAFLVDMEGRVLHRWNYQDFNFRVAELGGNGSLTAIGDREGFGLMRMDSVSRLLFRVRGAFHHDLDIWDDGTVYALSRHREKIMFKGEEYTISDHFINVISGEGQLIKSVSIYGLLLGTDYVMEKLELLAAKKEGVGKTFDFLHVNTVEVLRNSIGGIAREDDVLICARNSDLLAIVDVKTGRVKWLWGPGELDMPHNPTLLPNGNILIFDNGWHRDFSRVIELDPVSEQIVWEYKDPGRFFTRERGACQRLPNGNTLITESESGRVFEVTREGTTVWEWFNPDFYRDERLVLHRMQRIDRNKLKDFTFNYGK